MNSSVWADWAAQGSQEKKVDLSFSEQLLRVVFSTFCGQKKEKKFKYCRVRKKKLHNISFILFFLNFLLESKQATTHILILSVIQRGAL
jgi:hypothetical protein